MPKMKTKGAVKKRFKLTAKGRVKRRKCGLRHLLTHKSADRKRKLGKLVVMEPVGEARIKRIIDGH